MAKAHTTPDLRKGKGPAGKKSRPGKTVGKYDRPKKKGSRLRITVIIVLAIALVFLVVRLGRSGMTMEQMMRQAPVPEIDSVQDQAMNWARVGPVFPRWT
jgi:hypothetical protein